jgi:hypothetical protein
VQTSFLRVLMNRLALALAVAVCATSGWGPHAQTQPAPAIASETQKASYDLPSFDAELLKLSEGLGKKPSKNEMAALRDLLPREWQLSNPEGRYAISTQPLRNQLTELKSEQAKEWVDLLEREVAGYLSPNTAKVAPEARKELEKILTRQEYAGVRGPNAWDRFRERVALWISRWLVRLFGGMLGRPITGQIVFWALLIIGVACIGLWLFRFLASRDRIDGLEPSTIMTASRTWQEWLRLARAAANNGDFREAVHAAYWAGVVRLEDAGTLPRDRTKTPREYLRLVKERSASEPSRALQTPDAAARNSREPLAALTARLERAWYANRGANAEDFRESMNQLEALGCQLE